MNYIWSGMIIIGLIFSFINGSCADFTDGLMASCTDAVRFMIGLSGIMAVWSGIMEIAGKSGLINKFAQLVMPLIRFLFPQVKSDETVAMILMSFTANFFGAGNSATVFSLKAMERLDAENSHSSLASNSMCMFTAVSMSMVQLVPMSIIKIRQDLGSCDSGEIIIPSVIAGIISMSVSILVCKYFEGRNPNL